MQDQPNQFAPRAAQPPLTPAPPQNQPSRNMTTQAGGDWTTTSHKKKRNKGKKKKMQLPGMQGAVHLIPSSFLYVLAAQQAVSTSPPLTSNNKSETPRVVIMEVIVLWFGGLPDTQQETAIRAHLADAITCEVRTAVEKAVHRPIPIIVGQWSISSKSIGNFIYTLAGKVPLATIQSYERLLIAPFLGRLNTALPIPRMDQTAGT